MTRFGNGLNGCTSWKNKDNKRCCANGKTGNEKGADNVKIYRIARDYTMTLRQQEKQIRKEWKNVTYFSSDGKGIITIFAEGRADE